MFEQTKSRRSVWGVPIIFHICLRSWLLSVPYTSVSAHCPTYICLMSHHVYRLHVYVHVSSVSNIHQTCHIHTHRTGSCLISVSNIQYICLTVQHEHTSGSCLISVQHTPSPARVSSIEVSHPGPLPLLDPPGLSCAHVRGAAWEWLLVWARGWALERSGALHEFVMSAMLAMACWTGESSGAWEKTHRQRATENRACPALIAPLRTRAYLDRAADSLRLHRPIHEN